MKRYTLVMGNCFAQHRGGMAYTSLSVVGTYDTIEEAKPDLEKAYDDSSGLVLLIDNETGKPAE
jgi:hypothetical protein